MIEHDLVTWQPQEKKHLCPMTALQESYLPVVKYFEQNVQSQLIICPPFLSCIIARISPSLSQSIPVHILPKTISRFHLIKTTIIYSILVAILYVCKTRRPPYHNVQGRGRRRTDNKSLIPPLSLQPERNNTQLALMFGVKEGFIRWSANEHKPRLWEINLSAT